ncbi:MAG: macro domain-containing protein [Myxococcota bacterium]
MSPKIEFVQGSLTDGAESVLVNASNTGATLGSGVSGAIRRACGPAFQGQVHELLQAKFHGPMSPGQVLITHAGAHPRAKWVAHVAVMDYRRGMGPQSFPTLETINRGCQQLWDALESIEGKERLSVAMVALGAGTGDLGVAEPTRIAAETLQAHLARVPNSRIERVRFYGYLDHELWPMAEALVKVFPEVRDQLSPELRRRISA